jgi:thiol-disulfide isomerase/thioredoxin
MRIWILLLLLPIFQLTAQDFKSDISIVQYSAPFTKASEVSLKAFKSYSTFTFHITDKKEIFEEEKIKYLPTLILYHNGDEVLRVESGISLQLPEDTIELIKKEIEEIIESKF